MIAPLRWLLARWVKPEVRPESVLGTIGAQRAAPVCYLLERRSSTDVAVLENLCARQGLPTPSGRLVGRGKEMVRAAIPLLQARGFFDLRFFGRTASGRSVRVKVTGDRDPGYGSTAKMLGEAAMCLAFDVPRDTVAGGFWTPATIFGDRLVARLEAHAGLRFERQQ